MDKNYTFRSWRFYSEYYPELDYDNHTTVLALVYAEELDVSSTYTFHNTCLLISVLGKTYYNSRDSIALENILCGTARKRTLTLVQYFYLDFLLKPMYHYG